jgi:hypothetical protein
VALVKCPFPDALVTGLRLGSDWKNGLPEGEPVAPKKKGMHKMPGGHMMADSEMKKKMAAKGKMRKRGKK